MCSGMTSQGSAVTRFERALAIGKPSIVLAAAHELPQPVQLRDALRILLVLAGGDPERFPTAAARFGARLVKEHRLSVTEAQLAFAALATLVTPEPVAGAEALSALLERHDQREASRYLDVAGRARPRGSRPGGRAGTRVVGAWPRPERRSQSPTVSGVAATIDEWTYNRAVSSARRSRWTPRSRQASCATGRCDCSRSVWETTRRLRYKSRSPRSPAGSRNSSHAPLEVSALPANAEAAPVMQTGFGATVEGDPRLLPRKSAHPRVASTSEHTAHQHRPHSLSAIVLAGDAQGRKSSS